MTTSPSRKELQSSRKEDILFFLDYQIVLSVKDVLNYYFLYLYTTSDHFVKHASAGPKLTIVDSKLGQRKMIKGLLEGTPGCCYGITIHLLAIKRTVNFCQFSG